MQSGGSGGGPARGMGPAGRTNSTSSAASPTSSSSSVQQQQQLASRQQGRNSEANDGMFAYHPGGVQGMMGGGNFGSPSGSMQHRRLFDSPQQQQQQQPQGSSQDGQQSFNPMQQAYLQFALQAQQQKVQQQARMGMMGSSKDQDARMGMLNMQGAMQQASNQAQGSPSNPSAEQFARGERQMESGHETKPHPQQVGTGQLMPGNITRPMQAPQGPQGVNNMGSNQLAFSQQWQAMQAWARERNIDLSHPANASQMSHILQGRMAAQQKSNEGNVASPSPSIPVSSQPSSSSRVPGENSPRPNSAGDISGQSGSGKARHAISTSSFASTSSPRMMNPAANPFSAQGRDNPMYPRHLVQPTNGMPSGNSMQTSANETHVLDHNASTNKGLGSAEHLQMQQPRQMNAPSPKAVLSDAGLLSKSSLQIGQGIKQEQQRSGFTKQQLHVLKAQILAFRRLKKGEGSLPQELFKSIAPPPLEVQTPLQIFPVKVHVQDRSSDKTVENQARSLESGKESQTAASSNGQIFAKEEDNGGDTEVPLATGNSQLFQNLGKEAASTTAATKEEQQTDVFPVKSDQGADASTQQTPRSDSNADKGKAVASDGGQSNVPAQANSPQQPKDTASARKYHGPLFDFPFFTRKHDTYGSATANANNNLTLAYDIKDLICEEGAEFFNKKRTDSLKKINGLLARNLERKRIRPDLVLRLQIEEKKLRLSALQSRVRDEVDRQQQDIMSMPDRPYRKFVRLCERQRLEMNRQVLANQKAVREKQLKTIFQWRKKLLEAHWSIRDARTARNRGVAKYHEKMLREFSKRPDDGRNKRMEALKNNDVERYREMLLEQQTNIPGDAAERYNVLSSFLTQTEDYLHKLGGKITATKNQQEVEEAANAAAIAARLQGLSEEEVRAAAACAREEVLIRNRFVEMNAPKDNSSVNKYYTLAHAVNEVVVRQPSMLQAGTLRDYQLVGLQWMLSLYNNKLNGILADEMGLGKTVQVMALIAYLMEFKGNYGPHLIIVPNAVLVNWKSELHTWLPSVSCIYYVGTKDQRSKLFSQEVCAMKFNVLVTTYEFIMYDRSKLSKVDWKYIVIDEAQRMKDRESVLARDLDRYRCQRRLLLTGTPLQNDLKELWSLLNLLLPDVFDNRKAFHDWFAQPFQREGPSHNIEDDWLETEKKVIVIHRLHQILEPFMLRRRVEDVEGSLPPKVSVVLRCRMSSIQSAVYDWIKATGTLRVDPDDEKLKAQKNPIYQAKIYKTLNNRCMELRKTCNHPLLNYPYFNDLSKDFLVRSCGKLWILDRILIKLQRTGHRVLLFSTMTKLLDILEEYLQWRRLVYRRIDGTTSLEDRESAIVDFNDPDTDCFIFLLSIRAAGRGLNLQTADTVVIYDPDPNPKNEEQAVARAHRIGQTREVKVIYMEAVVEKMSSHQKEDELRSGGSVDLEDDLAGKDRYIGSIEGLIRNNIQQYKIDMADEVINAGRFDQRTTHEERRMTLETLLHDEERYQETVHDVPSLHEVNRMIARSEEEVELFDQMDEEFDWTEEMTCHEQVPKWLRASTREVNATVADLSKKPSKNMLSSSNLIVQTGGPGGERKRGRPKSKKINYKEIEDDIGLFSEESSEEVNVDSGNEEEGGDIGQSDDDELTGALGDQQTNNGESDGENPVAGYDYPPRSGSYKKVPPQDDAGSSESSPESHRSKEMASPVSSKKFGSLSALDTRPGSVSKRLVDDLEDGEIGASGDSHIDLQRSYDRDEGGGEQVLQPTIKRKRSIRLRPRQTAEGTDGSDMPAAQPLQGDRSYRSKLRTVADSHGSRQDQSDSSSRLRSLPAKKVANTSKLHVSSPKSGRLNATQLPVEDNDEAARETWDGTSHIGSSNAGARMSPIIQKRCKTVISKLQRRIDKEGQQIVPMLTNLWKRIQNGYAAGGVNNLLELREIDQRVERLEYVGVMELASDVQYMLRGAMQFYGFSHEVRSEARKVHNLFFDLLKMSFPDTDFREARNALSFSGPSPTLVSTSSPRGPGGISQGKRPKPVDEEEPEPSSQQRENSRIRVQIPQKETKLGGTSSHTDESPILAHPGELVICKKKRKDREKSGPRTRTAGSSSPVSPQAMIGRGRRSPVSGSVTRETRLAQATHPNNSGAAGDSVGWANPVKKLRTDSGKRRPSHL
ncbi:PREDICTED: ATP-dependent helicase BRM-like isoform X2 [Brassica oleracea var. oleracea]|uniref:ATP-dependent helicase BRM-like isoform X2 n=1 Tax=Brassica oleracea var. oleracea TaxID=109376 RepID=UPI0006A746E0|nr:PREDICTED: ATP-dependent helicase BRM-like isoform X2 [Brassica oleracea var. oleracea]